MKKIFLLSGLCLSLSLLAQQPPAKFVAPTPKASAVKPAAKPEEKKVEEKKDVKQTSLIEDAKEFYKSTEKTRTELKNKAITYYNGTTNSPYFQIGKCTVAGLFLYYGVKQFKSFTLPQQNARMGEFEIGVGNPFAEDRPKAIYHFLTRQENFKTWLKDPVTKSGIKIVVGSLMLTKQIMEGVSLYQKAVKRYL